MLALASALAYGVSDVLGGLAARRMSPVLVALLGQLSGLLAVGIAAVLITPQPPAPAGVVWGAASGVGTGVAMVFLFRGMARGAMSVVVPVSAVGGVALPVLVGVALLGERPSFITWSGVVVVVPALWLVSRGRATGPPTGPALRDGLLSGVGIAVQYLGLAQAGPAAGLWPVAAGRVTAVAAVAALAATALGSARRSPRRPALLAAAAGVLAGAALTAYLLATHTGYVTVAVVLSSLYPLVPVLVGLLLLGERLRRTQGIGLAAALAAATLVAAG